MIKKGDFVIINPLYQSRRYPNHNTYYVADVLDLSLILDDSKSLHPKDWFLLVSTICREEDDDV